MNERRTNPTAHPTGLNNRGEIVGNVFGLAAKDYSKPSSIDPVLWRCPFSG